MTYRQIKLLRSKKLLTYGKNKNMCTFQNKNLCCKIFFFNLTTFSLQFSVIPLPQFFFFSSHFRQFHCHKSIFLLFFLLGCQFLFFSPHFWHAKIPNNFSLLPYNFDNLVAIIYFFSPIFGNKKFLLIFFFLILPYNFANLVAIIYNFFLQFLATKNSY